MHTHDVDPFKMTILDINGEMQLKDFMGSIVTVNYCIPVPDFYLLLNDLRCRKSIRQIHKEMKSLKGMNGIDKNLCKTDHNLIRTLTSL